jgi:hypothetical protein
MKKLLIASSVIVACMTTARADLPGKHPAYLHALTDLRTARWLLSHQPGDVRVYEGEDVALDEVNAAIGEIKKAAVEDGKDIDDRKRVDVREHGSRLLRAIETLRKAEQDISQEEDNPESRGLKHRAQEHIERAVHAAEKAHAAWLRESRG